MTSDVRKTTFDPDGIFDGITTTPGRYRLPMLPCLERAAPTAGIASGEPNTENPTGLVLFLHGLGCAKQGFADPFSNHDLYPGLALLAPDLPGHGDARDAPPNSAVMENMAAAAAQLLAARTYGDLHIIAHSMGGAVGLLLIENHGLKPASFINLEGNLTDLDCGLLSRRAADTPQDIFVTDKFAKLKAKAGQADDLGIRQFAAWLEDCHPRAFHIAARSLVDWSDSGRLLTLFRQSAADRLYLHGERSGDPATLALLDQHGIETRQLDGCGHFAFIEQPDLFHRICSDRICSDRISGETNNR